MSIQQKQKGKVTLTWASSSFSFMSLCLHTSTAFVVDCAPALALLLLSRTLQITIKTVRGHSQTLPSESSLWRGTETFDTLYTYLIQKTLASNISFEVYAILFITGSNNKRVSSNGLPCLQLVVVNTISISEDKEVVLLITLAGFVLHIPVVFPCNLIIIPEIQKMNP